MKLSFDWDNLKAEGRRQDTGNAPTGATGTHGCEGWDLENDDGRPEQQNRKGGH